MNNKYADTFEQRGHPYDQAMQRFPDSRNQEFERLFDDIRLEAVQDVLDLPSGGGYLARHLPDHCQLSSADPSQPFRTSDAIHSIDLECLDLPEKAYDLVVSLAALHHIDNKQGFLRSLIRALRPGGYCCFADVARGSGISQFLDQFAGAYNGTGHKGDYLDVDQPYPGLHQQEGAKLINHSVKPCPWLFDSESAMATFARLLFGLSHVTDEQVVSALKRYVGFDIDPKTGQIQLNWELLYITVQKTQ